MNEKKMRYATNFQRTNKSALAKLILFVSLFFIGLTLKAAAIDGTQRVTLKVKNESIKNIFQKIENQVDVHFMYETNQVNTNVKISLQLNDVSLEHALNKICANLLLRYEIINNNIVIKKQINANERDLNKITISGIVYGADDAMPLPGVAIKVKGTNISTTTDFDGSFTLNLNASESTLLFSYIGYTTQEVVVNEFNKVLNIRLVAEMKQLNEVVVVGYGTVKKSQVVGAISSVSMKESTSRTYNSTAELLQGTVAGVTVINNGGDPTAQPTINIRGVGSINAEAPLIVLDGIIYSGSFNDINPNDIASISVLKDAASASIYGARASGGVILVTSKKGSAQGARVNVNYQGGFQNVAKKLVALNAAEYADAMNTATDNAGLPRVAAFDVNKEPTARTTNTVWMDEIFRQGIINDLTLSIDGATEKSNFFISGGYRKNEGILLNTFSERYTARANSSFKISPKFTIGENITYSLTNGQTANTTSGYVGAILSAIFYPPNATIYKQDGSGQYGGVPTKYIGSYGDVINPVAYLKRLDNSNPISTILINPYAQWEIVTGLTFKSNWGVTRIENNSKQFISKVTEPGKIFDFNQLIQSSNTITDVLGEQTLTFDKKFGSNSFTVLGGYTYQDTKQEYFQISATGFDNEDPSQRYFVNGKDFRQLGANGNRQVLISYVGRLNYSYADKYLISGIIRRDGTSKLTSANRWEVYPSLSAGWLLSNERFMENSKNILSNLKLRASWGQIGNLGNLQPYEFSVPLTQTSTLLGSSPIINFGYAERKLSNPNLIWESSEQTNLGLDFGLLKNKFSGAIDVFVKTNKNMLVNNQLPGLAGANDGQTVNTGKVENKGIELSLNYNQTIGGFKMDFTANASMLKNRVVSIKDDLTYFEPQGRARVRSLPIANVYELGSPLNSFYGFSTNGLFQSMEEVNNYVNAKGDKYQNNAVAGDIKFKDINNDGVINNSDRIVLGNPFPKTTYSFNANLNYKGFDLNIFFQGVAGNSIFNAVKHTGLNASFPGYNLLSESKNAWSPTNRDTSIPILSAKDNNNNFGRISDFYIEDGSYLRLRNVAIGYTFNNKLLSEKVKLRMYLSAQNLFTISKYSGMDPEVGLNNFGMDLGLYPLSRIYMSGINLSF
jgi:TonB-linked SusC/RagA family outer membrane protein